MVGFTTLFVVASATLSMLTSAAPAQIEDERAQPKGIDVSAYHENVNWNDYWDSGVTFGYVMASEGIQYSNPLSWTQYSGCRNAGMRCGHFHVADPTESSGYDQAYYFVPNGVPWKKGEWILPGALVLGYKPKGDRCYGLSPSELVAWIRDFSNAYNTHVTRNPVIVTTYDWWVACTGNDKSFSSDHPLWQLSKGSRPGGWNRYSLLELSMQTETKVGEIKWNGSAQSLKRFAEGS